MSDRDWRAWAYSSYDNWPECIPPMGPKRKYGPYPWGEPRHDALEDIDRYPFSHPDAASVGHDYWGDTCPWCGVPLAFSETVVRATDGKRGTLHEISPCEDPVPTFHPECWNEREAKRAQTDPNTTQLGEYA